MSPKKLLVLTAIVAVLFAFIVLFEHKMPTTSERQRKGDLYWDIPAERVTRLVMTRGTEMVELERTGGAPWRLTKPDVYPADAFAVNNAVSELAAFKRAGGDTAEARLSDYGLDQPVARATLVWADPEDAKVPKTRTIDFGIEVPGADIVAARVDGKDRVLFAPASTLAAVRKPVDEFRSKDVFGGSSGDVTRLEILRGRGRLVLLRKDGAWWLSEPFADLADAAEADRLVGQLTSLRAREFLHGTEDLAALSLSPPLYRVSITAGKGAVTSVDFGATRSDGASVYARRDGQVLTVERDIVDDLSKEAEPFRSQSLLAFDRSNAVAVDGRFGDTHRSLVRGADGWSSGGRSVLAPAADDLLTALLDLKSKSFLDAAQAQALEAPTAEVTVRLKTGSPWVLTFSPRGAGVAARVSSRPGAFLLEREALDKLSAAFEKAVAPPPTPGPTKKSS